MRFEAHGNKGEKAGLRHERRMFFVVAGKVNLKPVGETICARGRLAHGAGMAEASGHFMRVEREAGEGGSRHYVVHVRDPKFAVEMIPDAEAADKVGAGVLKRVSVPNSWAGNYGQYAALVKAAQEFFRQSMLTEPVAKNETRRLKF